MQKRKFDELISHFNRNVSDMSIDRKYKIELLGMISAIGFAHEEELGTNLAEVGTDCISREQACDALDEYFERIGKLKKRGLSKGEKAISLDTVGAIKSLPPIQPEIVRCKDCKHYRHGLCMKASMCVNKSENGFCDWAERRKDG